MCDVPSTAVCCTEYIECFVFVLFFCFGRFLFFLSLAKRLFFSVRKLTANELNLSWIITVITMLTNFAISLCFSVLYSTGYLTALFLNTTALCMY
jgi:hypothetical protein